MQGDWLVPLSKIQEALAANSSGDRASYAIRHGTMRAGLYAPVGVDPQTPHSQDELYIVISGSGSFVKGDERRPFAPGDLIFVKAGAEHRFEDFTPDFQTWVIFWGPDSQPSEG